MFFVLAVPAHPEAALAAGRACTSGTISISGNYPVSVLRPALSARLALGREDSS